MLFKESNFSMDLESIREINVQNRKKNNGYNLFQIIERGDLICRKRKG